MATTTETAAAAITLGDSQDAQRQIKSFTTKASGDGNSPYDSKGKGRSGPPGSGGSGPPGSGGGGAANQGGGRGGKLGGNPPSEFNGDQALVNMFINEFNLYCLANVEAEQMTLPMKRAALFLGFIKGPDVKDWVKKWTNWTITQVTQGRPLDDKYYWDQDTGARERAEDRLQHLAFIPGEVDTFIAQFESLAEEATYNLNNKATLSLFAAKLLFKMMDHIYKVTRPLNFNKWKNTTRQYHQDNTTVQNIRGIYEETVHKKGTFPPKKQNPTGFMPQQWAKILGVKMPSLNPNTMDTWADQSRNNNRGQKTRGQVVATETPNKDTQQKEGHCFTCNKQGHISKMWPDKKGKSKTPVKVRAAETEEHSDEESIVETQQPLTMDKYIKMGRTLKEEDKISLIRKAVIAQVEGDEEDF